MVDEKWYNADVTAYDIVLEHNAPVSLFFGYSDEMQTNTHQYGDILPVCNDIMDVDCIFTSENDRNLISTIYNSFKYNGKGYVIIFFENNVSDHAKFIQAVADRLNRNISYTAISNQLFCIFSTN
jgi:hypothetical protein